MSAPQIDGILFFFQSVVASVVFLVSGGAALMANILTLPTLPTFTTPQEGRISSTIIVDFVGIVLMEACYVR